MSPSKEISIYGGGMSGLIAAINLAREDFQVTVHDAEKGYGGSSTYNPSTHVTPMDPVKTSEYIGIDITPVFHQANTIVFYLPKGASFDIPTDEFYAVERGNRPTSLDTLLYDECVRLGVAFQFESPLRREDLGGLPPNTIIACGLTPSAYKMLDIPYRRWFGWITRGEIGVSNYAWTWWGECITEYGYFSSVNNYFFDLLFSSEEVSRECLERYKDFRMHNEGMEHHDWEYISGVVPAGSPDNPRLFWEDKILCGTISGAMDPLFWFGISGALVTGKIAATAVTDPQQAQAHFDRFTRRFKRTLLFKDALWYPFFRKHVGVASRQINALSVDEVNRRTSRAAGSKLPGSFLSIPGFGRFNCGL